MTREPMKYSLFFISQRKNRITFESVYHYLGIVILVTLVGINVYTKGALMYETIPSLIIAVSCAASIYLTFNRQSLVIDNVTRTVKFGYSSIRNRVQWKKSFDEFREVLLKQIKVHSAGGQGPYRYNFTILNGNDDDLSIPVKPSALGFVIGDKGIKKFESDKEFSRDIAVFMDIPFTEMYE